MLPNSISPHPLPPARPEVCEPPPPRQDSQFNSQGYPLGVPPRQSKLPRALLSVVLITQGILDEGAHNLGGE